MGRIGISGAYLKGLLLAKFLVDDLILHKEVPWSLWEDDPVYISLRHYIIFAIEQNQNIYINFLKKHPKITFGHYKVFCDVVFHRRSVPESSCFARTAGWEQIIHVLALGIISGQRKIQQTPDFENPAERQAHIEKLAGTYTVLLRSYMRYYIDFIENQHNHMGGNWDVLFNVYPVVPIPRVKVYLPPLPMKIKTDFPETHENFFFRLVTAAHRVAVGLVIFYGIFYPD